MNSTERYEYRISDADPTVVLVRPITGGDKSIYDWRLYLRRETEGDAAQVLGMLKSAAQRSDIERRYAEEMQP